jgi:hypothetical protein
MYCYSKGKSNRENEKDYFAIDERKPLQILQYNTFVLSKALKTHFSSVLTRQGFPVFRFLGF